MEDELGAAFDALIDGVKNLKQHILRGPNTPLDEQGVVEGYKWIFSLLQVATDTQVWADAANPRFVEIVGPYKKWGGDNADAFYQFAPIDPSRTYRVSCHKGDAVYLSLTVYGGPNDGRYSERIIGSINDRDLAVGVDEETEFFMGPNAGPGTAIVLEPDAVCAITRDYLVDPVNGRRARWKIESLDPPAARLEDADDLARRFAAALTFLRDQAQIVPLALGEPNSVDEPYPVPTETFGWAAGDAAYAMGSFDLDADHALVITGRSPECAFWSMCLWNPLLHTYNYDYERVTINGGQVEYKPDGTWTIVVAPNDPGHANWVSTAGHPRGRIWFRWFCLDETPERPMTRVVRLGQVIG